jgi:hypothetical protein
MLLALPPRSEAHGLGAECKVNGDRVEVEAYFDDDSAARNANVRVEDADQQLVAEGRTDARGCWSFPAPAPGSYRVTVDAGAGHRTRLTITLPATSSASTATVAPDDCSCCQDPAPVTVSDGPSRAAFTGFAWLKLGIGVSILGGVGGGCWIARRVGAARSP